MENFFNFIRENREKVHISILICMNIMYFMINQNFNIFHYNVHFHNLYLVISMYLIVKK